MCIDPSTHCWECDSCFQEYPDEMAMLGLCYDCWEEEQYREQEAYAAEQLAEYLNEIMILRSAGG